MNRRRTGPQLVAVNKRRAPPAHVWQPLRDGRPIPVSVTVLPRVYDKLREGGFFDEGLPEIVGVLWGHVRHDRVGDGTTRYALWVHDVLRVETTQQSEVAATSSAPAIVLAQEALRDAERERFGEVEPPWGWGEVLGSVHTHPDHGIFFSEDDLEKMQRPFFGHPWQIGMVVDPYRKIGGFFFWEDDATLDRAMAPWREFRLEDLPGPDLLQGQVDGLQKPDGPMRNEHPASRERDRKPPSPPPKRHLDPPAPRHIGIPDGSRSLYLVLCAFMLGLLPSAVLVLILVVVSTPSWLHPQTSAATPAHQAPAPAPEAPPPTPVDPPPQSTVTKKPTQPAPAPVPVAPALPPATLRDCLKTAAVLSGDTVTCTKVPEQEHCRETERSKRASCMTLSALLPESFEVTYRASDRTCVFRVGTSSEEVRNALHKDGFFTCGGKPAKIAESPYYGRDGLSVAFE